MDDWLPSFPHQIFQSKEKKHFFQLAASTEMMIKPRTMKWRRILQIVLRIWNV